MNNKLFKYLDKLFPNPKCELEYTKDYELLIAVMLSAQTTDKRVNMVTNILYNKYSTLNDLMNADVNDIINIIKPIGTFNKKSKNIILIASSLVNDCNGVVPNDREYLESLPGVGRKTANVVLANLFNEPCIAVDTHIARVSKRLKIASDKDSFININVSLQVVIDDKDIIRKK